MNLLCTSCSAGKRRDPRALPAIERYLSPRIRALAHRARRLDVPAVILSGEHGLLDPETPIPWYDHALTSEEVEMLAPRISAQLARRRTTRLVFYARPAATPGWRPYHEVLARACAVAGVALAVEDAAAVLVGEDPDLAGRLFDLVACDERTRGRLAASGALFSGYAPAMEAVHRENAAELESVLDRRGWPGRTLVGEEGAAAAWIIAQHAISRPSFQRRCRRLLAAAVAAGEAEAAHHARLVDRIRFNQGRPQVYGTILDWAEDGRLSPWPVEDRATLDERRRRIGLPPLAVAVAGARRRAAVEGERPPASLADRRRDVDEWRRAVGWLPPAGG